MPRPNFCTYPSNTPMDRVAYHYPNSLVRISFMGRIEARSLFDDRGKPQDLLCPIKNFPETFHMLIDGAEVPVLNACRSCVHELNCLMNSQNRQVAYRMNDAMALTLKKGERSARLGNQRSFK